MKNLNYSYKFQRNSFLKIRVYANYDARNLLNAVTEILSISRSVSRVFLDTGCKANADWPFLG
jgi:hypothetical protein